MAYNHKDKLKDKVDVIYKIKTWKGKKAFLNFSGNKKESLVHSIKAVWNLQPLSAVGKWL